MAHPAPKSHSLGMNAVQLTASKIISLCISMVTTMLLSRFRTFTEYGTYSQLLLVVNLFSSLFMLGLPNSINYFLARAETQEQQQKFLSVYYTLSTILSLVMGAVLVLAVPLIEAYFNNQTIRGFVYFLALYPWASVISSSVENVLVVYQRTRFLMAYRLINSICLLGAVAVIQWLDLGFSAYMQLYMAVYAAFAVSVYVIAAWLGGGLKVSVDKKLIRSIFVFSVPMGLATVVGTLNIEIDKLLIGRLMSTEELAVYTNASKELPLTIIASSITAVLLPQLARMLKKGDGKEAVRLWGSAVELSFLCISLIVAGVFTYAEDVMSLLYSEKYLSGLSVFRVYTLVLLLRCTYFGIILNAMGKSRLIFRCSVASLIFNAVLNPLLYLVMGMIGPAVATFLSMTIIIIGQLMFTARDVGISFRQVFPWKALAKISAVNVLMACCFAVLKQLLPLEQIIGSLAESLILGAVWTLIYIALMRKTALRAWRNLNVERN